MNERTYIFKPEQLTSEFKELFDGIEARILETGSIELKFVKPTFYNDSILQFWNNEDGDNNIDNTEYN